MARADREPLGRRFRTFLRTYRFALSIFLFAVGVLLTVLAAGDLTGLSAYPPFSWIDSITDQANVNYNLVFVVLGPIITIVGAYFLASYILARRRFEHLMETRSKAEFLRNLPEIEKLLWDLTPEDEIRYANKKADLRIRR
jgi:threonine/homoserine/homoserine lactone efflux protein